MRFKWPFKKQQKFSSWDLFFIGLAQQWAEKSKDPSTQVGAVIAKDKEFISGGFNGFAKGVKDTRERLENRELKYPLTLHAEHNAVLFAKKDLAGTTLYCTHPPCSRCAAIICQVGISKVIAIPPSEDHSSRWDDTLTREQFDEAGVEYVFFPNKKG